jgi:NAD(P)-dependent dehydrogenase (short-subunit alcohol dehydrogenase family)
MYNKQVLGTDPLKSKESFVSSTPMGRIAQPEEIADTVMWLLSNKSSFVTGQAIPVNGGIF